MTSTTGDTPNAGLIAAVEAIADYACEWIGDAQVVQLSEVIDLIRQHTQPAVRDAPNAGLVEAVDIVDRLKNACVDHPHTKISWPHRLLHEAIAERERLRDAQPVAVEQRVESFEEWCERDDVKLSIERNYERGCYMCSKTHFARKAWDFANKQRPTTQAAGGGRVTLSLKAAAALTRKYLQLVGEQTIGNREITELREAHYQIQDALAAIQQGGGHE